MYLCLPLPTEAPTQLHVIWREQFLPQEYHHEDILKQPDEESTDLFFNLEHLLEESLTLNLITYQDSTSLLWLPG